MVRQGSVGHRVVMKTTARRSPADRDRAVARLRSLTIGTSIASLAAVGGFGAMAALSYDGTSGGITTAAVTTDNATSTTGTTTTSSTTTSSTTGGTTPVQETAAPTATTGAAHAATGSS